MLVSNFQIGADREGWDTRYQLQVTNLESEEVKYVVACDFSLVRGPSGPPPLVTTALVRDRVPAFAPFRQQGDLVRGQQWISIGAGKTLIVEIASSVNDGSQLCGVVHLDVPPVRTHSGLPLRVLGHGVRVLLHARRFDFRSSGVSRVIDQDGYVRYHVGYGDAYSSESVLISTGRAENELQPVGFTLDVSTLVEPFAEFHRREGELEPDGALPIPEPERGLALLDLLLAVDREKQATKDHVKILNEALSKFGSSVRLQLSDT